MRQKGARRRRLGVWPRRSAILGSLFAVTILTFVIINWAQDDSRAAAALTETPRFARYQVQTDGVLDAAWAENLLAVPVGQELLTVDLPRLKALMESHGQVLEARVSIAFPDRLVIDLRERQPLLRALVRDASGPRTLIVARDGTVFASYGYTDELLRTLPAVTGIRLQQTPTGYLPVTTAPRVAEILDYARQFHPDLYRDWIAVSLDKWRPGAGETGSTLEFRGRFIQRALLTPEAYREQMRMLDAVIAEASRRQAFQVALADLRIPGRAAIRF